VLDGLLLGAGDAVIGVNPATDNVDATCTLLTMLDAIRDRYAIPTQTCVLASPPACAQSRAARRWIWCSNRSAAPRR
jgi:ethanolamine ammonia-lyase large subunit